MRRSILLFLIVFLAGCGTMPTLPEVDTADVRNAVSTRMSGEVVIGAEGDPGQQSAVPPTRDPNAETVGQWATRTSPTRAAAAAAVGNAANEAISTAGTAWGLLQSRIEAAAAGESSDDPKITVDDPHHHTFSGEVADELPTFEVTYWTGNKTMFSKPPREVWDAVTRAHEKHGCDPYLVMAVAFSESTAYNNTAVSSAGAAGVWQFMPGTWDIYKPHPGASRHEIGAAAEAACKMINDLGLTNETNASGFISNFAGDDGSKVWNRHHQQAQTVWDTWQGLLERTQEASEGSEEVPDEEE